MAPSKKEKENSKGTISLKYKILLGVFAGLSVFVIATSYYIYQMAYTPSVLTQKGAKEQVLYIPKGMSYKKLAKQLREDGTIQHPVAFGVFSKWMNYVDNVKAGRYILTPKMNTLDFVRQLRSGNQAPVNVTFNENLRFLSDVAGKIMRYGLVGQKGFFENFVVKFDFKKKENTE